MAAATERGIQATSPRDTFTGVAARSVPVTRTHPHPLPTPPNSISPALPPHGLKAQLQKAAKLEPIDSDLDLHDLSDDYGAATTANRGGVAALAAAAAAAQASSGIGSPPLDSSDAISPAMLAKFHLPEILLNHGPLAIRYIIGHLTASVPGFSFIPPAKSRRLVVAALEGRGNGADGGMGGLEGDVEFQKVSWGVWGARRVGGGARQLAPPPTAHGSLGIPIAGGNGGGSGGGLGVDRLRQHTEGSGALYRTADLKNNNNSRNMNVAEDEADRMSMDDDEDGPASASCSEAPDEDMMMDDDPDDLTDDEDWGAVGAAALRAESYSNSAAAGRFGSPMFMSSRPYGSFSMGKFAGTAGSRTHFSFSASARDTSPQQQTTLAATGFSAFQGASDEQEREAIEGLLRLGSV
ncbi:DNA-binding proteins Bright/BRCAA1/RBP1 and proteins containing BRIGHT domain [Sporothrix stenoceras]|uniref:DNA-binding proteins Bright/BRCAA1/RBP1 and proteins containing BRIGHT domain n=1 Tax=Sporothrix stenoceras TaxID=5173 RepID=A0ABR3ZGB1_9PEZI